MTAGISAPPSRAELLDVVSARGDGLAEHLRRASSVRDEGLVRAGRPGVLTYSRKVFVPVTTLCRDRCHYCAFVDTPARLEARGLDAYLAPERVLAVARQGLAMGCREVLLTLGDRPEARWSSARDWLGRHGFESTLHYVAHLADLVRGETGLLAHLNPGVMTADELAALRPVAPSMGMMLESTSRAIVDEPGGVHFGSPDKDPDVRLQVLRDAGSARIPFTTGLLVGIGETLADRVESILALRRLQAEHGHLQEIIVQNFRAKTMTAARSSPDADDEEYLAVVAATRIAMGPDVRVQAPPNLSESSLLGRLVAAGVDDWGGVSPLTADHVNPERPWPQIDDLARRSAELGFVLRERLTVHPPFVVGRDRWIDRRLHDAVTALADPVSGLARTVPPRTVPPRTGRTRRLDPLERAAGDPASLTDEDVARLLGLRGAALRELTRVADSMRRDAVGDVTTIVANRSLGSTDVEDPQVAARVAAETVGRGGTELCIQGIASRDASPDVYCDIARAVKAAEPALHLHAFRPADVRDGACRSGRSVREQLEALRAAGVDSIPGTGVKLLDEAVRRERFPADLPVDEWIEVVTTAHASRLPSTSVVFYGHGEGPLDLARHLRRLRHLQERSGGFTEVVPMAFAPQAPDVHRVVHAAARIVLHGAIAHVQAAWTRLGREAATTVLRCGADDLGGTLYGGCPAPGAGARPGPELSLDEAGAVARSLGRRLRQRSTTYGVVS